jgi:hypothetical protein
MAEQLEKRLRFLRKENTDGMPHSDRGLLTKPDKPNSEDKLNRAQKLKRRKNAKPFFANDLAHQTSNDERRGRDSNPRYRFTPYTGLANRRIRPLCHLSLGKPRQRGVMTCLILATTGAFANPQQSSILPRKTRQLRSRLSLLITPERATGPKGSRRIS